MIFDTFNPEPHEGGLTLRHAELHLLGSLTNVSLASTSDLLQTKHHPIRASVSPFASPATLLSLLVSMTCDLRLAWH
ncbi:hypothetical protein D5086_021775 [Populus alba]|uniref:Uncharacterized protein n=1 Tax=Populus alba TaxID=43335 RepID=A0ACC4BD49_POPAL